MGIGDWLRVVSQAELYSTAYHRHRLEVAVCLCHNLSVDVARGTRGTGTVVFHCLAHYLYLLGREPFIQTSVCLQYLTALYVMSGTFHLQPQVMVCRHHVCHVDVCPHLSCQLHRSLDNTVYVGHIMSSVERIIPFQYIALDELHYVK